MDQQTYMITFDDVSAADANRYAEELRQAILDASPDVEVHRRRDDPRTQDFGATLVLLCSYQMEAQLYSPRPYWMRWYKEPSPNGSV